MVGLCLAEDLSVQQACRVITAVLRLLTLLGLERGRVEREIIFRSHLLDSLAAHLQQTYGALMAASAHAPPTLILDQAREDHSLLSVFLLVLHRRLTVLDDLEFQGKRPGFLPLPLTRFIADLLNRGLAYRIFQTEAAAAYFESSMLENLRACVARLYERDKRLKLFPADFWIVDKSLASRVDQVDLEAVSKVISFSLYQNAPQTIPFAVRAAVFRQLIDKERQQRQHATMFYHGEGLEIRRDYIVEDAYDKIYPKGEGVKDRLRILFVDQNYITEEGVDGGGLFKEFMTKLTERAFDPHYAFFTETPVDHRLYPNYLSAQSHTNHLK